MKQYNPGRWVGILYMQSQSTASYMTFANFGMTALNLWALWELKIKELFPWLGLPLFVVLFMVALILLGIFDYVFVRKPTIAFQNSQACKHENPVMDELKEIKHNLKKHMGDEYEDIAGH